MFPAVIECFRSPLDLPVPRAHVLRSSHPIPSILDNNSECDPFPSFTFARDRTSRFFCRQSPQDVAGRPPRVGPCIICDPDMIRFRSLESPCRIRTPVNPNWRFRSVVSMRSEPVLARASPYDRSLYPVRSLRRKPITCKITSGKWYAGCQNLRIVHVTHSCRIEQSDLDRQLDVPSVVQLRNTSSETRPSTADAALHLGVEVRALAYSSTKVHKLGCLFISLADRLISQRVRCCAGIDP